MTTNHFENIVDELTNATNNSTPAQQADRLVQGICQTMQHSGNQQVTPAQLGQELKQLAPQISKTFQAQKAA